MSVLALLGGSPARSRPFPAYPVYGREEEEAVLRVLRTNCLCAQVGNETAEFEKEYAAYHNIPHAVAVSNGTTALYVALAAAGVGPGDEVIVPPYTFVATATAVVSQNAIPVFADIETESLGLDPAAVEKKITERTKAIIPVHMNGYFCDIEAIFKIARRRRLVVIEDCAHAHGAEYRGRKAGTLGDMGAFSFQHKKNMSLGEGGMVITANDDFAKKMRDARSFGGRQMFHNYRLPELQSAVGRVRLRQLDAMNAVRQRNARALTEALAGIKGLRPLGVRPGSTPVYYNYVVRYSAQELELPRAAFIKAVEAEGVSLPLVYTPLHRQEFFKTQDAYGKGCPFRCPLYKGQVDYSRETYPAAEDTCLSSNLEIKVHPPCSEADMRDIAAALRKVVEHRQELADYTGKKNHA